MRKPQPLGTEFKNLVCGISGIMIWLEVQEGKYRVRKKELVRLHQEVEILKPGHIQEIVRMTR